MIPLCDHTGTPCMPLDGFRHFTSSMTSGSASLMSVRTRESISPRQSSFGVFAVFAEILAALTAIVRLRLRRFQLLEAIQRESLAVGCRDRDEETSRAAVAARIIC